MSTLAVFVALGGTSYAVTRIDSGDLVDNTVRSRDIRNNDVRGGDIRNGTLREGDVKPNGLGGAAIDESRLGQVPSAALLQGLGSSAFLPAGGKAADADKVDGADSTAFMRYGMPIPSGATVTGALGGVTKNDGTSHTGALFDQVVTFPAPAPADLASDQVNFKPDVGIIDFAGDDDPSCTGSVDAPTAPAGKVCIYVNFVEPGSAGGGARGFSLGSGGRGRQGFEVRMTENTASKAGFTGSWAYTAP